MLGKASEIKTVTIQTQYNDSLGDEISNWQQKNEDAIVLDIKYAVSIYNSYLQHYALIIYQEAE